ncbi:MAG: hypothetical protein AABW50_01615 [Nanoarchaeota archaeon]
MKKVKVSFKFNGKKLSFNVIKCDGFREGIGLMFRRRKSAPALLFEFSKSNKLAFNMALTSLFVFFKFAAIWLDDKNNAVDFKIVRPFIFAINSKKPFTRIIEVPLNEKYREKLKFLGIK